LDENGVCIVGRIIDMHSCVIVPYVKGGNFLWFVTIGTAALATALSVHVLLGREQSSRCRNGNGSLAAPTIFDIRSPNCLLEIIVEIVFWPSRATSLLQRLTISSFHLGTLSISAPLADISTSPAHETITIEPICFRQVPCACPRGLIY